MIQAVFGYCKKRSWSLLVSLKTSCCKSSPQRHGIKMSKLDNISKKIWADKGVKGFGWKTIKVPRYICKLRDNPVARGPILSANSERFRDNPSQQNNIGSKDLSMSESQR